MSRSLTVVSVAAAVVAGLALTATAAYVVEQPNLQSCEVRNTSTGETVVSANCPEGMIAQCVATNGPGGPTGSATCVVSGGGGGGGA